MKQPLASILTKTDGGRHGARPWLAPWLIVMLLSLAPAAHAEDGYITLFECDSVATLSGYSSGSSLAVTVGTLYSNAGAVTTVGSINSIKLDSNSEYVLLTLGDSYTLQEGDSIVINAVQDNTDGSLALTSIATRSTDTSTTAITTKKVSQPLYYVVKSSDTFVGKNTIYVWKNDNSTMGFIRARVLRASSDDDSATTQQPFSSFTVSYDSTTIGSTDTLSTALPNTLTLTFTDSLSAVSGADSCKVTITKDGTEVSDVSATLALGSKGDDGYCYAATLSLGGSTLDTNGTYVITIPAGALMQISESATEEEQGETTASDDESSDDTTDATTVAKDTVFSEEITLTYTVAIADPTVTVARQVTTAKSLVSGDTLQVLTFDQQVTLANDAVVTLISGDTTESSYAASLTLIQGGDSAVVTLNTAISTDGSYTLTISDSAFTTTNWSSSMLTYTITVSSKETFYLVTDGDNTAANGVTISPTPGSTVLTLDSVAITLPADVTYNNSSSPLTVTGATLGVVTTSDATLTIPLTAVSGDTVTISVPAGALTYTSSDVSYANAAATLTYVIAQVTTAGGSTSSTYSWDFDDSAWSSFTITANTTTVDGLTVYSNKSGKTTSVKSYSATVGGTSHTYYLDLGGSGVTNAGTDSLTYAVAFPVTGPCTIEVGATSASASDTRYLVIADVDGTTSLTTVGLDTIAVQSTGQSSYDAATYSYTGGEDTLFIFSKNSGIRLYYITLTYDQATAFDYKALSPDTAGVVQQLSTITLTYDNTLLYAGQSDGISVTKNTNGTEETVSSSYAITSSDDGSAYYLTLTLDDTISCQDDDTTVVEVTIPEKTFCGADYVSTAAVSLTYNVAKPYLTPTVTPAAGSTVTALSSVVLALDSLAYYNSSNAITVTRSDNETVSCTVTPQSAAYANDSIVITFGKIETEDVTVTVTIPAGALTTASGTTNKALTYTYYIHEETETVDQSWNFSNWTAQTISSGSTLIVDGLTVSASSGDATIDASSNTIGGTSYTQRLKQPVGNTMTFDVDNQCVITVAAKGPNTSTDGQYTLCLGSDTLGVGTADGQSGSSQTFYCSSAGTVTISNSTQVSYFEVYLTYLDGLVFTNVIPEDNSTVESLSKIYLYYDQAVTVTDTARATYRVDDTLTGTYGTDVTLAVSSSNDHVVVATVPTTAAESGKSKTAKLTLRSGSIASTDGSPVSDDPIVLDYIIEYLPLERTDVSPATTSNPAFIKYIYVTYDSDNDLTLDDSRTVSVTVDGQAYSGTVTPTVSGKKLKITLSGKIATHGATVTVTLPDSIVSDNKQSYNVGETLTYTLDSYGEYASFHFQSTLSSSAGTNVNVTNDQVYVDNCSVSWSGIGLTDTIGDTKKYYKFNEKTQVRLATDDGFQAGDSIVLYVGNNSTTAREVSVWFGSSSGDTVSQKNVPIDGTIVLSRVLTASDITNDTIVMGRATNYVWMWGATVYRKGLYDPAVEIATDYTERYVQEQVTLTSELVDFDGDSETYQWYSFAGTDSTAVAPTVISDATQESYTYTATTDKDTTSYVLKVTYTSGDKDTTLVSDILTIITNGYAKPVINTYVNGALTEGTTVQGDTTTWLTAATQPMVIITSRVPSDNVTYYYKSSTTAFDSEYSDNDDWAEEDTISALTLSTTAVTYLSVAAVYGSGDSQTVTYSYARYVPSGGTWAYSDDNVITRLYLDLPSQVSKPLGVTLTYTIGDTTYDAIPWGMMTLSIEDDYATEGYYYSSIVELNGDTVTAEMEGTTYITVTLDDVTGLTAKGSPYKVIVEANLEPTITLTSVTYTDNDIEQTVTDGLDSYYTAGSQDDSYTFNNNVTSIKFTIELPSEVEGDGNSYSLFYTLNGVHPTWDTTTEGEASTAYTTGTELSRSLTTYVKAVYYKTTTSDGTTTYDTPSNTAQAVFTLPSSYVLTIGEAGDSIRSGEKMYITNGSAAQTWGYLKSTSTASTETADTLVRITLGGEGDYYTKSKQQVSIWDTTRVDSKGMLDSYIGEFMTDALGLKDAKNEAYTATVDDYGTFVNIYKSSNNDASFYSDTLTAPNTFDIPITGCYFKIEPRQDGEVNFIVRQNGIITDANVSAPLNLRKRPVYVTDETGTALTTTLSAYISPDAKQESAIYNTTPTSGWAMAASNDTTNLLFYQKLAYYRWKHGQGNTDVPPIPSEDTWTEEQLTQARKFWFGTTDGQWVTDSTNVTTWLGGAIDSDERKAASAHYQKSHNELYRDGKGWLMMSRAFVRYSFPVEAGKAYFIMGNTTKLGPCGASFHPRRSGDTYDTFVSSRLYTLTDSAENVTASTTLPSVLTPSESDNTTLYDYGQSRFQLLNRTFYKDGWTSIVLPFSVNTELLERTFGDSTRVVHYNGHDGPRLLLCQHYHQMIVAGTPVFIRPTLTWTDADGKTYSKDTIQNVTFDGIAYGTPTYQQDDNGEWQISSQTAPSSQVDDKLSGDYYVKGSYFQQTLTEGCYVIGFSLGEDGTPGDGTFYSTAAGYKLGGCRAWLEPASASAPKLTSVAFNGVTDFDDDSSTTGIFGIVADDASASIGRDVAPAYDGNIYNVSGQLVRRADQGFDALPAGLYIVNGRKVVIK